MGISGLNTFFDNNPRLSRRYELHNTKVVIDGNNLANALYFDCGVDCVHGGDYNRYATLVKDYFQLYLQCDVEPIVIFDGGYDRTDSKLRTVIQRANRRLKCAVRISKQLSLSGNVLPLFAIRVFKDVLQDMEIQYAQCPFEADAEITAIANHYQCPVISGDSDFYIFDVISGFIRLDYIDVKVQKKKDNTGQSYCFLNCVIYYIDSFLSLFHGIKKCVLPLFSTLMGNDFADEFEFNNFFCSVQLPKVEFKNLQLSERHEQMIRLLLWLKHHDINSATEEVLKHIKEEKRKPVKKLIKQATNAYRLENSDFVNYFDHDSSACTSSVITNLFTSKNNPLPRWFSKYFHEASLCPFLLNAVGLRRVFLQSQVEDMALPSAYTCSLYIRQVLYGLLLSRDDVLECNTSENCIEEYDRVVERLQQCFVKPVVSLEGFGALPKLCEEQLDAKRARLVVLHTLGDQSKFVQSLPEFLQLYIVSVRYYLRNCSPKPSEDFIDALLLVTVYLSVAEPLTTEHMESPNCGALDYQKFPDDSFKNVSILHIIENVSLTSASYLKTKLEPHLQKPKHNKEHLILPIIHSHSQLQGCLNFVLMLNELVGSPFETPRIQSIHNGSLTYRLTKKLMEQNFPDSFLRDTLGPNSTLDHLFQMLKKKVLKHLPLDCLKWRSKKKRSAESAKNSPKHHAQLQKKFVIGLSNKFDALRHSAGVSSSANIFI